MVLVLMLSHRRIFADQIPRDPYGDDEDESDLDSEDEEAHRLEDVSSDVEVDADELNEELEDDSQCAASCCSETFVN